MPQLEFVIKGLKKKSTTGQSCTRLPITPEILWAVKAVWECDANREKVVMLWAAACMCFFGFLRSGEVVVPADSEYDRTVHLSYGDVQVDSTVDPKYLEIRIKVSKIDLFGTVYLGKTGREMCPVAAILAYMVLVHKRPISHARTFCDSNVGSIGANRIGISGHSFRIGAALQQQQRDPAYQIH